MATIHLHGQLGEKYGRRFDFEVYSVAEALRLLNANFQGFNGDLLAHKPGFVVRVDGEVAADIGGLRSTHLKPEIHIVPAIAGAGGDNNGLGQILMAVVLIAAAWSGYFSPTTTSTLYAMGANLAISGVSTLLFSTTAAQASNEEMTGETNLTSYSFNGPVNTTAQGNPVPVLYGWMRVGSQVISAGVEAR